MGDILYVSVVLYHNTQAQLKRLLAGFGSSPTGIKLFFVDNTPGGCAAINQIVLPDFVTYLPQKENIGFGAGHNLVINKPNNDAAYNLILNPDAHFAPGTLQTIISYMQANPDVALLMPKIVWPNGEDQGLRKLLPTPFDLVLRRFMPGFLRQLFAAAEARYQLHQLNPNLPADVPVLSGCFMFCRAQALQNIGGFDENYFLYVEDVDLCRRMLSQGKNRYWPGVSVVHEYQKESYKTGKQLQWHIQSAVYYFNKFGWLFDSFRKQTNAQAIRQKQPSQL